MDAFALPMDADPSRDQVVGYDEFGRPVRAGRLGTRYIQGAAPAQRNSLAGTPMSLADVMATSGGARGAGQPRQTSQLAPANAPEPSWGPLGGLANMLLEGFQAPGNALAGRPVTLGEVYGTAGTAALGGTAVPRPANALGANSFRAYQGSPHNFDKFSMDKIGTGEGAQAYGHGLYFADTEGIAKWYRDKLAGDRFVTPSGEIFDRANLGHPNIRTTLDQTGDVAATRERAQAMLATANEQTRPILEADIATLDRLTAQGGVTRAKGSMYEVNINADPEKFIDWDKPLNEQPQFVRDILGGGEDTAGAKLALAYKNPLHGGDLARMDRADPAQVSAALKERGIPGIKFLDAGSRGAGQGSRNYVVFDDALIDIVRKYGWAAAAPMLAQMGMTPQQAQAQYEAQN